MATEHGTDHGHDAVDAHGHGHDHGPAHGDPNSPFHIHHPGLPVYFITYAALLVLLAITVGLYKVDLAAVFHWRGINVIVALIVAIIKAALVVLLFMNVRGGTRLIWLWASIGFIWLLLISGIFQDYLTRAWVDTSGWQ